MGQRLDGFTDLLRRREAEIRTDSNDDVHLLRVIFSVQAKGLTYDPLDPVSSYRPADFPVDAYANPAEAKVIGTADQAEPAAVQPFPFVVDLRILPPFTDLQVFRE